MIEVKTTRKNRPTVKDETLEKWRLFLEDKPEESMTRGDMARVLHLVQVALGKARDSARYASQAGNTALDVANGLYAPR